MNEIQNEMKEENKWEIKRKRQYIDRNLKAETK